MLDTIVYVRGTNTDTQDAGNWECTCSCKMRERGTRRGKDKTMEESMCCACVHMRAQKPNKSGHEYECNHTIEYTTFLPSNL